ncbi:MAG: hypothetical protein ACXWUG_06285 [Polyangiales bacterium]
MIDPRESLKPEENATHAARKAGARMLAIGAGFLVVGLVLVVLSDWKTGGAVTHPEIAREGRGISLLAGAPATLGYVVGAVGVYRLLTGRGPGHASKHPLAIAARVLFGLAATAVFFVGAFLIVMKIRG